MARALITQNDIPMIKARLSNIQNPTNQQTLALEYGFGGPNKDPKKAQMSFHRAVRNLGWEFATTLVLNSKKLMEEL